MQLISQYDKPEGETRSSEVHYYCIIDLIVNTVSEVQQLRCCYLPNGDTVGEPVGDGIGEDVGDTVGDGIGEDVGDNRGIGSNLEVVRLASKGRGSSIIAHAHTSFIFGNVCHGIYRTTVALYYCSGDADLKGPAGNEASITADSSIYR